MAKIEIKGLYSDIEVFTSNIDDSTKEQILKLANQQFTQDLKIKIMPDCHAGAGAVIGTTMEIKGKVVPNLVGVDIGCGMITVKLGKIGIDLPNLDSFITAKIPSGMNSYEHQQIVHTAIHELRCWNKLTKKEYHYQTMGTLGGGNHFIEVDEDSQGNRYLIIHSGSRNLGKQVADFYQKTAIKYHQNMVFDAKKEIKKIIEEYKHAGREQELEDKIRSINLQKSSSVIDEDLCYLDGSLYDDYIHDMAIAQKYASENRFAMAEKIIKHLGLKMENLEYFQTIHNYINMEDMILRKGAISAYKHEIVLIPINMRDGCILGRGKSCAAYNYSAPHGAGRLLSRREANDTVSLKDFKDSMKDVYSTSVNEATIDESPFAYKPMESIIENIKETVEIIEIIKPIYNFKCSVKNKF